MTRSLLESQQLRQEITESVMKHSTAELAKGIQHRQEMESVMSDEKLKQMAHCLVKSSKGESKQKELLNTSNTTKDIARASEVTLRATHSSRLATINFQDLSLQMATKAAKAADSYWKQNVEKIVSDSCIDHLGMTLPQTKKQEI